MAYASVGVTITLFLYLQPSIFFQDFSLDHGFDLYFRGIAALGILLFSMLVITLIFDKLHVARLAKRQSTNK